MKSIANVHTMAYFGQTNWVGMCVCTRHHFHFRTASWPAFLQTSLQHRNSSLSIRSISNDLPTVRGASVVHDDKHFRLKNCSHNLLTQLLCNTQAHAHYVWPACAGHDCVSSLRILDFIVWSLLEWICFHLIRFDTFTCRWCGHAAQSANSLFPALQLY